MYLPAGKSHYLCVAIDEISVMGIINKNGEFAFKGKLPGFDIYLMYCLAVFHPVTCIGNQVIAGVKTTKYFG
jgi:hypothetical protein